MEDSVTETKSVHGVIHLDLRNDGPAPMNEFCASVHLTNHDGSPLEASLALSGTNVNEGSVDFKPAQSCLQLASPWPGYQSRSFDLHFRTSSDSVPASGFVLLDFAIQAKEPAEKEPETKAKTTGAASGSEIDCVFHAKPLALSFNFLPSKDPAYLYLPLDSGLIVGLVYLVAAFIYDGKKGWLRKPMGGAQWNFSTSFATNFTVGTGLLSLVLGGTVITDALHYMTKTHYVVLSLFFAAVLLIAPALFTFFSTPHEFRSEGNPVVVAPAAPVWLFLLTSSLMMGAVIGQLCTVGLAMDEVRYLGYLSSGAFSVFAILLGFAGIGAFAAAMGVVPAYFKQKQTAEHKQLAEKIGSLKRRAVATRGYTAEAAPAQEPLNDDDMRLLDHLIAREQAPPKWTMF